MFFGWGKKENTVEYLPGGRVLNVRLKKNLDTGEIKYYGIYASRASFYEQDVRFVEVNRINDKQGIVIVQGDNTCLATFDILPIRICLNMERWLVTKGVETLEYDEAAPVVIEEGVEAMEAICNNATPVDETAVAGLKRLKELYEQGLLSEAEYQEKRQQFLDKLI